MKDAKNGWNKERYTKSLIVSSKFETQLKKNPKKP
jgi:hypothetical protein